MKVCPECGATLTADGKQCVGCGYQPKDSHRKKPALLCRYITHGRPCPLHAHRGDGTVVEYCAYHYMRRKEKLHSEADEYAWFLDWCHGERWQLCTENPALLWKILCGLVPLSDAPVGAWSSPDPWQGVIDGTMTTSEYWSKLAPFVAPRLAPSATALPEPPQRKPSRRKP